MLPGQLLHASLTLEKQYTPKASVWGPDGEHLEWKTLFEERRDLLEKDLLGTALEFARELREATSNGSKAESQNLKCLIKLLNSRTSLLTLDPLGSYSNYPAGAIWTIRKVPGLWGPLGLGEIISLMNTEELRGPRDQLVAGFLDAGGLVMTR